MGRLFAIVVWFMVLQQVPRCALLALGASRECAAMALWNAVLTVVGIVGGYALDREALRGAILGNALGNVAGCVVGWLALSARGLHFGRGMSAYSLSCLAILGLGEASTRALAGWTGLSLAWASLVATALIEAPIAGWVWRGTIAPLVPGLRRGRARRRAGSPTAG